MARIGRIVVPGLRGARSDRDRARRGDAAALRGAEGTGHPLGSDDFVAGLEQRLRRSLRPAKRGRKPRVATLSEATPLFAEQKAEIDKVSP